MVCVKGLTKRRAQHLGKRVKRRGGYFLSRCMLLTLKETKIHSYFYWTETKLGSSGRSVVSGGPPSGVRLRVIITLSLFLRLKPGFPFFSKDWEVFVAYRISGAHHFPVLLRMWRA